MSITTTYNDVVKDLNVGKTGVSPCDTVPLCGLVNAVASRILVCGVTTPSTFSYVPAHAARRCVQTHSAGIFPRCNPRTHFTHAQEHGGARMAALIARARVAESILTSYDHTTKTNRSPDFSKSIAAEPRLVNPAENGNGASNLASVLVHRLCGCVAYMAHGAHGDIVCATCDLQRARTLA